MSKRSIDMKELEALFKGLGRISEKSAFGDTVGLYAEDVMFAIVGEDSVFLSADPSFAIALAAEGARPFVETTAPPEAIKRFWSLPDAARDNPEAATSLARRAIAATKAMTPGAGPRMTSAPFWRRAAASPS